MDENEKQNTIKTLEGGIATEFWALMVKIMQENIDFLGKQILSKESLEQGSEGDPLTDAEVDILRNKRNAQIDLMNCPTSMLEQLRAEDMPVENLDPYFDNVKDLRRSQGIAE